MPRFACCLLLLTTVTPAAVWGQFDNPGTTTSAPLIKAGGSAAPKLEQPAVQHWKTGVQIRAVGGPCANLTGTFPVPMEWPEQQVKIVNEETSTHFRAVNYRTVDGLLKQAVFAVPLINAGEIAALKLTFEVTNYIHVAPTDTSGYVIPKTVPTAMRKFIGPSPYIDTANIKFKNLAKDAIAGKETAWEQVDALADAIRKKVQFEHNRNKLKGAVGALTDGKADREDLMSVFIACCRVLKIPTRMVWVPDSCYAEFYLENDKGEGHWFPAQLVGEKQIGFLTDRKPILQKGDNIKVPETKDAQRFVPEFLTGKGKSGGQPEVDFIRRLEGM